MRLGLWVVAGLAACRGDLDPATPTTPSEVTEPAEQDGWGYVPPGYAPVNPSSVIVLGDSIAAGYGTTGGAPPFTELLLRGPSDGVGSIADHWSVQTLDYAAPGARTDTMNASQIGQLAAEHNAFEGEVVVLFTIGGNDIQKGIVDLYTTGDFDPDAIVADALAELEATLDHFDDPARYPGGATVWFTNVYDPTDNVGYHEGCFFGIDVNPIREPLFALNEGMRALAEARGVAVLDLYDAFQGHGYYHDDEGNPSYRGPEAGLWFAPDCIHPNNAGHQAIREMFARAMKL